MANAASGVAVDEACVAEFMQLKKSRKYKYIVYKMADDNSQIIVEALGAKDASFEEMLKLFPEAGCRYGVYNHEFTDGEGCQKEKIVFIQWSPDVSKVRDKMLFASSKDSFRKQLDGVHLEIQATDASECDMAEIKRRCE